MTKTKYKIVFSVNNVVQKPKYFTVSAKKNLEKVVKNYIDKHYRGKRVRVISNQEI